MTGKLKKRAARILAVTSALLITVPWLLSPGAQESAQASSIRLTSIEGTVSVSGQGGKAVSAFENMRILNGYGLETGQESYAGFSLDDTKAAKLDALSTAEVRKKGKKLELLLSAGSILCDVKEPLESGETMNIRTSTMITGIRGTVLYIKVLDQETTAVYMLEGSALIQGIDPVTGQTASVQVSQGQKGIARSGDTGQGFRVSTYVEGFQKEEIDGYVLTQIAADYQLAGRLEAAGWDTAWMKENAQRRLLEDQKAMAEMLAGLEQAKNTGEKRVLDQVYEDISSDSDSDNSGTGITRENVTLTMPVTAAELNQKLQNADVTLNQAGGAAEAATLSVDQNLTVPADGSLVIGQGISVEVQRGAELQVDGTMKIAEGMENSGTIRNTSAHTLEVGGPLGSLGILENTGRLQVGDGLAVEAGVVSNTGDGVIDVQGNIYFGDAELTLGGKSIKCGGQMDVITGAGDTCTLGNSLDVDGPLNLRGGKYKINGGIYKGGIDADAEELELAGGRVYGPAGLSAAVNMNGGTLSIKANVLRVEDISATAFVDGTGTLNLGSTLGLDIENLDPDIMEAVEGADGWELKMFSSVVQRRAALRMSLENMPVENAGAAVQLPASPSEAEKGPAGGQGTPETPVADPGTTQTPEIDPGTSGTPETDPGTPTVPGTDPGTTQTPETDPGTPTPPETDPGTPTPPGTDPGTPPPEPDPDPGTTPTPDIPVASPSSAS